jgi:hypothetical protein
MPSSVLITVLGDGRESSWAQTACRIRDALVAASDLPAFGCVRISLTQLEEWLAPPDSPVIECVICHPTERVISALRSQERNLLLVLVSGGERPAWQSAPFGSEARVIWFSGVYGREDQFQFWLRDWLSRGLTESTFDQTREALFTGKAGIAITGERLRKNLLSVQMVFESYQAIIEQVDGSGHIPTSGTVHSIQLRLINGLSEIWTDQRLFATLSKDAALIYGAIRNWTEAGRASQLRLTELLGDFLPRPCGHFDYDPLMDESFRMLLSGKASSATIDKTVADWTTKLTELSSLLRDLPGDDPGKQTQGVRA